MTKGRRLRWLPCKWAKTLLQVIARILNLGLLLNAATSSPCNPKGIVLESCSAVRLDAGWSANQGNSHTCLQYSIIWKVPSFPNIEKFQAASKFQRHATKIMWQQERNRCVGRTCRWIVWVLQKNVGPVNLNGEACDLPKMLLLTFIVTLDVAR